ncbi:hypothetical protein ACTA71_004374 [Dictyostelium dimigraforme]
MIINLYFKVFKDDILRRKIFQCVKEINTRLFYKTFGYYDFPLLLVIKTRNQSMLEDRMGRYEQNVGSNEFNKECLEYLMDWKRLDLFKLVEHRFKNKILEFMDEINYLKYNFLGLPLEMLQYLIKQYEVQIDIKNNIKDVNNLIIPTFKSDGSTITLLEYLINDIQVKLPTSYIVKIIYKISVIQNESELFAKQLLDLVLSYYNFKDRLEILLSSINSAIETNDYYLFHLLILKIKEQNQVLETRNSRVGNNGNNDDGKSIINLYDIKLSKEFFLSIPLTRKSLFKSNNFQLFKIIIEIKPELIKEQDEDFIQYDIVDPNIALLLLSTFDKEVIVSPRYRFNYSSIKIINYDISEVMPFMKKRVLIGGNKTITDLTTKKLDLFQQGRLNISNIITENTDGFGGDVQLFKKFLFINRGFNLNLLQTLKSAIILGYQELVELIITKENSNKIYIVTFNNNFHQLKQIFNIHGNDIMPFENGFTKIENGKLYYTLNLIPKYNYLNQLTPKEINNEKNNLSIGDIIQHHLDENIISLPLDKIERENYLIRIYKNEQEIKDHLKLQSPNLIEKINENHGNNDNNGDDEENLNTIFLFT